MKIFFSALFRLPLGWGPNEKGLINFVKKKFIQPLNYFAALVAYVSG